MFNETAIHIIEIDFSQPDYWDLLVANKAFDDSYDSSTSMMMMGSKLKLKQTQPELAHNIVGMEK